MRSALHLALPALLASPVALADDPPAEDGTVEEAAPAPVSYDLSKSDLIIQVFKDTEGLGAALAHDHAIKAKTSASSLGDPRSASGVGGGKWRKS